MFKAFYVHPALHRALGDETAQVVVEPGTVNETSSLQIAEILAKHAQITSDNLTIIEAKEDVPAEEDVKK